MPDSIEAKKSVEPKTPALRGASSEASPPTGFAEQPAAAKQPAAAQSQILLDESKAMTAYANFCRVTGTPEELIIDFGLNPQPFGTPTEPILVAQRLIVNFYTAKRLLAALSMTLQRHETAFGVLETDVKKRVMPAAMRQPRANS